MGMLEMSASLVCLFRWTAVFTADVFCATGKYMALFILKDSSGALVHIYFMKEICQR